MPAPMPHSAAATWVSNSGSGTTPQARRKAGRSSPALCMTLRIAGADSTGASAAGMPGASMSSSRIVGADGSAPSSATCTSASCGQ